MARNAAFLLAAYVRLMRDITLSARLPTLAATADEEMEFDRQTYGPLSDPRYLPLKPGRSVCIAAIYKNN